MKYKKIYMILLLMFCSTIQSYGFSDWYNNIFEKRDSGIGFAICKIPVSARQAAMGGTYAASADPYEALASNPSRMLSNEATFVFNHQNLIQGIHQEFFGFLYGKNKYAIGFTFSGLFIDGIEYRTRPGPSEGEFSAYDFIGTFSVAYLLYKDLSIGLRSKIMHEKIFEHTVSVYAFDIGFNYTPKRWLDIGATLENLGPKYKFNNESEGFSRLPTGWRIGFGLKMPSLGDFEENITLDTWKNPDLRLRWDLGGEIKHKSGLALRLGGRFNSDTQGFTAGMGYRWRKLNFNYAFLPYDMGLGHSHMISLSISL